MARTRTNTGARRATGRPPRGDEPTLVAPTTVTLYRAVDAAELAQIDALGHRRFPRVPDDTFFEAVSSKEAAQASAAEGANFGVGAGWVTRFAVSADHYDRHAREGGYRIAAAKQASLDEAMVGPIVVIRASRPPKK